MVLLKLGILVVIVSNFGTLMADIGWLIILNNASTDTTLFFQERTWHSKEKPHNHLCIKMALLIMSLMGIVTAILTTRPAVIQTMKWTPGGVWICAKPTKCFLLRSPIEIVTQNDLMEQRSASETPLRTMATTIPGSLIRLLMIIMI